MSADQERAPAKRADAERNRDKILAAARAAFAEPGVQVSMAEVARRAGVGMATLYRNFPGRRELLEALYTDEVDAICAAARDAAGGTPGEILAAWLYRFAAFFTSKHHIAGELLADSDNSNRNAIFSQSRARVLAAGRPLLAAAQRSHEVRDDLTLEQILDMVIAIAAINGGPGYSRPILGAALDGLRLGQPGGHSAQPDGHPAQPGGHSAQPGGQPAQPPGSGT
jgi:AcrR family transcriptional regulator